MAKNDNLKDFLTDVADAIRAKKGTSAAINPQDFSAEIASIETGGGGAASGSGQTDVRFLDCDGTLLHSFSKDEFLTLDELPSLPTRQGLICQGWNYSIADAKAYVEEYGVLDIGATYITDDGKTRLYITIETECRMDLPLYFYQNKANGVTIDWGDGSALETLSGTGSVNTIHSYANTGNYCISLDIEDGCIVKLSHSTSSTSVMGSQAGQNTYNLTKLRKVELGKGINEIGSYTFQKCALLSYVVIPNNVTKISARAFTNCTSLLSAIIPNSVTELGGNLFYYCYSLSEVVIPNSVKTIESYTFYNCYNLSNLVIPDSVSALYSSFCYGCYGLRRIIIPNSVVSLGESLLYQCYALQSIRLPEGITSIAKQNFYYCYSLSEVVIPNGVKTINESGFGYCCALAKIHIPTGVETIGTSAFTGCSSLSKIVIPNSVTTIGSSAFSGDSSLREIDIPNSVTSIGTSAFSGCYSLSKIVIPKGVTTIGSNMFANCYGMAIYDFSGHISVPTLSNTNAFSKIPSDCKIVVPDELYDTWIAATNWSTYASQIVKASEFNG